MTLLATVHGRGTLAARPAAAAANEGYIYFATDGAGALYRSNAASWDTYSPAGLADQGTATFLDFTTAAAPANPAAGKIRIYSKTGDTFAQRTSGGTETVFGAGGGAASRHSPGVPTGTLLRSYTFDTTVESWTASAGTITAVGAKARLAHTGNTVGLEPVGAANQADGEVEGLFTMVTGAEASVAFRVTDADNFYMMTVTNGTTATVLYKCVAGTFTAIRSCENAELTGAVTVVLMARFIGSLIEGYLNGRHMFSVVDTTYTTGRIGMRTFNGTLDLDTIRLYQSPVLLGNNV